MNAWKKGREFLMNVALMFLFLSATGAGALAAGAETKPSSAYPPDNTGKNIRDVQGGPLTPEDQSGDKADVALTQKIRKVLIEDQGLSMTAKNIKIITVSGVVTLRGPVNSAQEKETIASKATQIAGAANVKNQLEVIPSKDASLK